jgi:hypothetical protein
MDGATINQMLTDRVKQVCQHLLPNGKELNGDWAVVSLGCVEKNSEKMRSERFMETKAANQARILNSKRVSLLAKFEKWWALSGSNRRPADYESDALTN